jgi:hypothetical protein
MGMSENQDRSGGAPLPAGTRVLPARRPRWMVLLAGLLVVAGFHLLVGGLSAWRTAPAALPGSAEQPSAVSEDLSPDVVLRRSLAAALARVDPVAVRAHAGARVILGLLFLFVVAAILMKDPRGRSAALTAAWGGIIYHVASALYFLLLVREGMLAEAPRWAEALIALQGQTPMESTGSARAELIAMADTLLVASAIVVAVVGIGFSLVLMAYFGGRQGRAFYGVLGPEPRPHGER